MPLPDDNIDASPFDMRNATVIKDSAIDRLPTAQEAVRQKPNKLDDQDSINLFQLLMAFYIREIRRQEDNRAEQEKDEEFYDNEQWDELDARTLKERGQQPIVYNVIAPTLNWIIGTEKRSRTDFKILPRRKDAGKAAERKTQLLKYLSDVNRTPFNKSLAFEDAVKVGVGWLEVGLQDESDGEPVYERYESWRNMLWDSAATERDLSDARYIMRSKWVDLDISKAMFPKRKGLLDRAAVEGDRFIIDAAHGDSAMDSMEVENGVYRSDRQDFAYKRQRVRLIECWYRAPANVQKLRGGDFGGQIYDRDHAAHSEAVANGHSVVVNTVMMRMHVAIFTVNGLLFASQSPYRHNDFPFTPIWANKRGKNGLPYGVIRGLRNVQEDVNKRASKALHILNTSKTIMDEGAVPDVDEFAEEVSRPDAIIVKRKGHELTIEADRELAPAHLELMSKSIEMIQSASGVTDENMGRKTNATSGIAIQARQNQGSLATAGLFDNLRLANQIHGEKMLSMIEQFFTDQKSFRITNMRGTPDYVTVNDGLPENDIIRTKADFVISEDDWRMSIRQAQTAELLDLLKQLAPVAPQIALVTLDLLVEAMDIPNREEIVNRIRQQTGMRDPDQTEPTKEDVAKAKMQAEQQAMQKAMVQAELAEKQAGAALKAAQAQKAGADIQKILAAIAGQNVQSQIQALEAAIVAISQPHTVPIADGILHEAGFKGRTEQEEEAMMEQAKAAQQAQQAQAAQAEQQAAQQQQAQADPNNPAPASPDQAAVQPPQGQ
ncbi:hypothetical protein GJ654_10370 [Rhodoblastus acidophilus]|uniref:Portal protein n=1 Tax=Rhodoblastus acidophilus TaxID=1074 RepID=A0A6N8DM28_RHOAC|nr:hypothetical protein [Rhodoblastus acidophilus]MCW2275129.1 hypothetical protein [Rhodoblastus acidophilus]MTV31398.1 hypothetical protein [Rhodoblastus acidophilus]